MSSELFESLEFEFTNIITAITRKINSQIPNYSGEQKKQTIKLTQKEIDEAEDRLEHMEMELRSQPAQYRAKLQSRVKGYRTELDALKRGLSRAANDGRAELLGGPGGNSGKFDYAAEEASQREKLLMGTDRLNDTTRRIENAHQVGIETEDMGQDVLRNLDEQRGQIVNSTRRLQETDSTLSRARSILNTMARKAQTNKMIMLIIILLFIGVDILIAYLKFISK